MIIYTKEVYGFVGKGCDTCWRADPTDSSLGLLRSCLPTAQAVGSSGGNAAWWDVRCT